MHAATLRCGSVLTYEAQSFVPDVGELVPCTRHGYCIVQDRGGQEPAASGGRALPRARPRTQSELIDWLRHCPVTTLHALRRHRFTLRMISEAAREGHLTVDFRTGRVTSRALLAEFSGAKDNDVRSHWTTSTPARHG